MVELTLQQKDKDFIWHPFTQSFSNEDNILVRYAKDAIIYGEQGETYIDAISSWWVNIHGHANERINNKIIEQLNKLDHVIFAGFTHEPAIEFAEKLLSILPPNQKKIFFSDNGSTSVEVALKMCIQYWCNKNKPKKKIIAFRNAYHGDTFGSMSVGDRGPFSMPFQKFLFDVIFIDSPAQENSENVGIQLREACQDQDVAAFIFEPLVQGAGGMLMYSPEVLNHLIEICRINGVLTIADEVMTGFGRTGRNFAVDYLIHAPDIICLSKGITGGVFPLGATTCTNDIYNAFESEDKYKTFFHGHSYTGNPVIISAALESLAILKESDNKLKNICDANQQFLQKLRVHPLVGNPRALGTILAFDVKTSSHTSYFNKLRDNLYQAFLQKNILLRPLGNVIYIMPPYCITEEQLQYVFDSILEVLDRLMEISKNESA